MSMQEKSSSRTAVLILSGMLLLCLLLTACQGDTEGTIQAEEKKTLTRTVEPTGIATSLPTRAATLTPEPVSGLEVTAEELEGIKVEFWYPWSGRVGSTLRGMAYEFNTVNEFGIKVESTYQGNYDDVYQKMQTAMNSGYLPDIVVGYNFQALSWRSNRDIIVDLNNYVTDAVWGFTREEQTDFLPVFWDQDASDGMRLGIPAQRYAQILYYNQSWAKELGFEQPPQTPAEFKEQVCAATEAYEPGDDSENGDKGGWIISTEYPVFLGWIYAFGGEVVDSENGGYIFDSKEVEEAFSFLRDLYDQDCAWLSDSIYTEEEFASRSGLIAPGSLSGIPYQADAFIEADNADDWTVIPFPSKDGNPVVNVYGPAYIMVESNPEQQLASWIFIKWLSSPQNQADLARISGIYPARLSGLDKIGKSRILEPQWAEALDLMQYAHPEPNYGSWRIVRWALSDAATQLFRYYFESDQVPDLVELLDDTADELHQGDY